MSQPTVVCLNSNNSSSNNSSASSSPQYSMTLGPIMIQGTAANLQCFRPIQESIATALNNIDLNLFVRQYQEKRKSMQSKINPFPVQKSSLNNSNCGQMLIEEVLWWT
jgi:hypothetical protein